MTVDGAGAAPGEQQAVDDAVRKEVSGEGRAVWLT
jgi:hypothetical protein